MNLSPKAIRFVIEALEYRIKAYQERLNVEEIDEDEASDITNDTAFIEEIRSELEKTLEKLVKSNMPTDMLVFGVVGTNSPVSPLISERGIHEHQINEA